MRARIMLALGLLLAMACGAAPASAQNRFSLVNNTGQIIERIYVSPSRVNNWGRDVLGDAVLYPGQSFWVVPRLSDCVLDIRVVFQGGAEETRWQVNACSLSRIVWGGAPARAVADPSFRFVNRSGVPVNNLHISLSSDRSWGPDRLGRNVLPPGRGIWVSLPAGKICTVDIRVVYTDGTATERRNIETCTVRELHFR